MYNTTTIIVTQIDAGVNNYLLVVDKVKCWMNDARSDGCRFAYVFSLK